MKKAIQNNCNCPGNAYLCEQCLGSAIFAAAGAGTTGCESRAGPGGSGFEWKHRSGNGFRGERDSGARKTAQMTAETVKKIDTAVIDAEKSTVENDTAVIDAGEENTVEENDAVATKAGKEMRMRSRAQGCFHRSKTGQAGAYGSGDGNNRKSTPSVPYRLGEGVRYSFLATIAVKSTGETAARNIRLQVPLVTDDSPTLKFCRKAFLGA